MRIMNASGFFCNAIGSAASRAAFLFDLFGSNYIALIVRGEKYLCGLLQHRLG